MRRGEQANAQTTRAINALEHGARRAFAVRAGDVDETELAMWIAGEFREPESIFQPKLRAEDAEAVEELDGFGVGHCLMICPTLNRAAKIKGRIRLEFFRLI